MGIKIFMLILLLNAGALAQWTEEIPITRDEMERRAEEKYIKNNNLETFRYYDNIEIEKDELVPGNIIVIRGDLEVWGEINGDVLTLNGDVRIHRHAVVAGNITSVGGHIIQHQNSMVSGNQIETSERNIFRNASYYYADYDRSVWQNSQRDKYSTLPLGPLNDRFIFRYNRVQGLFLGLEIPKSISGKRNILSIYGFGGYGFQEKRLRYRLGIDRYFFDQRDFRFEVGASFYDLTDTRDEWIITPLENTLASLLIHEDFQDFYRRKGFDIHVSQNFTIFLKGSLTFRNDEYESLKNNTDWALFGGKKTFRLNPEIDEGNMRSLTGEIYLDTRNDQHWPRYGWYGKLSWEYSDSEIGSDFSFDQIEFEVRHYLPVSRGERFDFRIMAGSANGHLPLQKVFQIGGFSTLRGFDYKEFVGDRLLLANIEYTVSPANFSRDILFFDDLRLIFYSDIGAAWFSTDDSNFTKGFEYLTWNSLKSNIGIAFSDWKGHFRIDLAKRTDTNRKPLVFSVRLAKPF
jgi:hypothetical protein